jgi:protein SCO1/2
MPANVAAVGGPFRLASSDGVTVDSAELEGKPFGIFFGFTHCPQVCPTTLDEMTRALQALGDEAKDFRPYFVTVDPERDTAPLLKEYVSNFDPRIKALIPTPKELPVLARAFGVVYEKVPMSDGGYPMNHTTTVYLIEHDSPAPFRGVGWLWAGGGRPDIRYWHRSKSARSTRPFD